MGSLKDKRVTTRNRLIATVMVVIILTTLAGCDSATNTEVISAQACFSKREIEIPLRTNKYWGLYNAFAYFDSRKTLEQIKEKVLEWDSQATVEIWGNQSIFISSDNPDTGKKDYYIVYRVGGKDERFLEKEYCLDNYSGNNPYSVNDEPYAMIIKPYHLVIYTDKGYPKQYIINYDENYELHPGATIEDVYSFYSDSGYYDVEMEDNRVVVKSLLHEWTEDETDVTYVHKFPVVIEVFEKDGKSYFKYTT